MLSSGVVIAGSYNCGLVTLFVLIGMFAPYAALDLRIAGPPRAGRIPCSSRHDFRLRRRAVSIYAEKEGPCSIADRPRCALGTVWKSAP
jgi:hypothetical protein